VTAATTDLAAAWRAHLPPGVGLEDLDLLREVSLPAAWSRRAAEDPGAPALVTAGGECVTRGDLAGRNARVAGRLHAAGLRRGDRLVLSAGTSADLVAAYAGALRLGLVVLPMNTAYREREVAHIAADARPAGALVDDPERGAWVRRAAGREVVVAAPDVDLPDPSGPPPALDAAGSAEPALLCYTSGTTGAPKGAVLSHGNLLASAEALRLAWRWRPQDRLVLSLPLFHVHGLGVGINGTLLAGASAVLLPRFDVDGVLDAVSAHAATLLFGVPTHYARLADSPRVAELGRLRLLVSGSAPLPADLSDRLAAATGQRVLERYGMTETIMNVSNPYEGERRAGSVGLPLPGVEVRLAGGDPGEVLLRGPNVFSGYWERPEATADAFDADGWFRSGDIGSFDDDGYLRIVGRSKELIISGGYNVYPREVEDVLRAHPAVADAAVVGRPSAEWGEQVVAYVVPRQSPVPAEELLTAIAASLASYKRPKELHWVEDLPRNALGKVLRHELP
jgi:malonyl-CoA/methylmalonyl-CoA synthetase